MTVKMHKIHKFRPPKFILIGLLGIEETGIQLNDSQSRSVLFQSVFQIKRGFKNHWKGKIIRFYKQNADDTFMTIWNSLPDRKSCVRNLNTCSFDIHSCVSLYSEINNMKNASRNLLKNDEFNLHSLKK